jgi:uncharacterized protein YbbC (DUF1343 family)
MKLELPINVNTINEIYGPEFKLFELLLEDSIFAESFTALTFSTRRMFEKVTGTDMIIKALESGENIDSVIISWKKDVNSFRLQRKKYLLYN